MRKESLSFAALEARIKEMPDGPSAVLNTPQWLTWLNGLGALGVIIGIAPFLMIQFLPPRQWMVPVAQAGLWITLIGWVPYIVRGIWVIGLEFWRWRPKLVEQSDHDLSQFRELRRWLVEFPRAELEDHQRFAQLSQQRLTAKLGLLQGGFDKLGVLPALLALLWLFSSAGNSLSVEALLATPWWQSWLASMFVVTYLISLLAVRMRLSLQLYELVLADALDRKPDSKPSPGATTGKARAGVKKREAS